MAAFQTFKATKPEFSWLLHRLRSSLCSYQYRMELNVLERFMDK
jgi:hypothetical protein